MALLFQSRHPELVSRSIPRFARQKRRQPQPDRKINPVRVALINQVDFPGTMPALKLFFAQDSRFHFSKQFEVNQSVDAISACETRQGRIAVPPKPGDQIRRYTNVKRAVMPARKDVDAGLAFFPHAFELAAKWTLKQVQGDEKGIDLEAFPNATSNRHAELVSASIGPRSRDMQ